MWVLMRSKPRSIVTNISVKSLLVRLSVVAMGVALTAVGDAVVGVASDVAAVSGTW